VVQAGEVAGRARLAELLLGHVDADDRAGRADEVRGHERVGAGAAAEVEHAVARRQAGEVEHVPDAGVRAQRLGRDGVQPLRRVAEALGQRAAHLEVEVAARVAGDVAVHRADLHAPRLHANP